MFSYPLKLDNTWFDSVLNELTPAQTNWLFEVGSLTAKLKSQSQHFEVKVLSEVTQLLSSEQAEILGVSVQQALFREVILYCDGIAQVYAQSWIPLAYQNQHSQSLTSLGSKPLGEMIFKDPNLTRNTIEIAKFTQQHGIAALCQYLELKLESCWGRRSVFSLQQQKLLVCEIFLPGSLIETSQI